MEKSDFFPYSDSNTIIVLIIVRPRERVPGVFTLFFQLRVRHKLTGFVCDESCSKILCLFFFFFLLFLCTRNDMLTGFSRVSFGTRRKLRVLSTLLCLV